MERSPPASAAGAIQGIGDFSGSGIALQGPRPRSDAAPTCRIARRCDTVSATPFFPYRPDSLSNPMQVAVLRETFPGERRVALVPAVVPTLLKAGLEVVLEAGAGAAAGI